MKYCALLIVLCVPVSAASTTEIDYSYRIDLLDVLVKDRPVYWM
jgi:hypothetical protein